jgi:hypothetical protein
MEVSQLKVSKYRDEERNPSWPLCLQNHSNTTVPSVYRLSQVIIHLLKKHERKIAAKVSVSKEDIVKVHQMKVNFE